MRVKVSLCGRGLIPFDYNLALAGAVYGPIKRVNTDLAYTIHSSTDYKFFTFSQLQVPKRSISKKGIYVNGGAYFLVSSPISDIIMYLVEGLLEKPIVKIGKVVFDVESMEMLKNPQFGGQAIFSTVSPIIVRTVKEENGRLKVIDLYPTEVKFYENLKKNIINKYEKLYCEKRDDISFSKPFSTKFKRIRIKNTFHCASLMIFEAQGDSELLRLGYETGFGEKNSMGFGMVKVIKKYSKENKNEREGQN